jgi:predicted Zn-dependent protease
MWCWATGSEDDALLAEREYGRECAHEFTARFPGCTSATQQEIVAAVGARLCAAVKDARRQFRFTPLPAPAANAFALPGGFVFITAPLVDLCAGDRDQMAFFLAHEMGHVLRGHSREQFTTGALLNAVTARVPGAGGLLHQVLNQGYSRQLEFDADREAVGLTRLAGFDPRASIDAMQRLSQVSPDTAGFAEYFASHPPFADRIRKLEKLVAGV